LAQKAASLAAKGVSVAAAKRSPMGIADQEPADGRADFHASRGEIAGLPTLCRSYGIIEIAERGEPEDVSPESGGIFKRPSSASIE
jgi:hypothetical protein